MLAKDLLSNNMTPLKTSDSGIMALSLMEEYKTTHLPIANSGIYFGLVSEDDIYSYNHFEEAIGAHPISQANISALANQHIYDILQMIHENKLSLLPIVDEKNHYLGSVISRELIVQLADITGIVNPGGIIILEMNIHDYSLSEIAQIVESNNRKIINCYVGTFKESTKVEVTIKLNSVDIEAVLQTFIRYNYQIKASYTDVDLNENLTDRYDSLMNYLNI
jgi:predicted transcriptional regulator